MGRRAQPCTGTLPTWRPDRPRRTSCSQDAFRERHACNIVFSSCTLTEALGLSDTHRRVRLLLTHFPNG